MLRVILTTVATREEASSLAHKALDAGAACAQIDGPVTSVYRWDGRVEQAEEWRLMLKVPVERLESLREQLLRVHPYQTPEWIELEAAFVTEKYLQWSRTAV
jgi:periplasmic divalent cation tolerance protein